MGGAPDDGGESRLWLIVAVGGAELEEAAAAGEGGAKIMAGPPGDGAPGTARVGMGGGPGLLSCGGAADLGAGRLGGRLTVLRDLVFDGEAELEEAAGGSGLWLIARLPYISTKRSPYTVWLKPPT